MGAAFEPFKDFTATDAELEKLKKLRDEDRYKNVSERFDFFMKQDPKKANTLLGFVPLVVKNGFTCVGVPAAKGEKDLAFSVGYFYSFQYPEIMLLAEEPSATMDKMQKLLQYVGVEISDEDDPEEAPQDEAGFRKYLEAKMGKLVKHFVTGLGHVGLKTEQIGTPDEKFLEQYAYGYGWYFYRHFLDDARVPLLMARVK